MLDETIGSMEGDSRPRAAGTASERVTASSESYLPWIALAAVAAGVLGALAGWKRQPARRPARPTWNAAASPGDVTPPHGDKLLRHE